MTITLKLIALSPDNHWAIGPNILKIGNDADLCALADEIEQADVIELHFPAFTDGRAFSQAVQLRKRYKFTGEVCATGDVLIDQLLQMQRSGFSSAVLRADQNPAHGQKLLAQYNDFYQADIQGLPAFARGVLA
jgi:uncharacterized protein (DUF934 family)